MGLDNGIILHSKNAIKASKRPECVTSLGADDINGVPMWDYEICYWRKCWNIRREVAHIIDAPLDYVAKHDLDIYEVKNIWRAIYNLNSPRTWDERESIWTYEEITDNLDKALEALEWLIQFMREHKDDEYSVEFYDSY